jgi:hypothetical protein
MKKTTKLLMFLLLVSTTMFGQITKNPALIKPIKDAGCNCKQASIRFARLNKLNVTAGNNYRVTIEVNTAGLKCTNFKLTKLTINGKVISMPMTYFRSEEMSPDGDYKMFLLDITMPEILPEPEVGKKFNASAVFSIGGNCPLKFPISYYGVAE